MNHHQHSRQAEQPAECGSGASDGQGGHRPADSFSEPLPGLVMASIRSRRIWGEMLWRRVFPGRGDQAAPARRLVKQLLLDTPRADDAEWVAAELISNALRHTRSGEANGYFVVEVRRGLHEVRVVVYDLGGYGVPNLGLASEARLNENGHGLPGVSALAVKVGVSGDSITGHAVSAVLALTCQEEAHEQAAQQGRHARLLEAGDPHDQAASAPDQLDDEPSLEHGQLDASLVQPRPARWVGEGPPLDKALRHVRPVEESGEFLDPPVRLREAS